MTTSCHRSPIGDQPQPCSIGSKSDYRRFLPTKWLSDIRLRPTAVINRGLNNVVSYLFPHHLRSLPFVFYLSTWNQSAIFMTRKKRGLQRAKRKKKRVKKRQEDWVEQAEGKTNAPFDAVLIVMPMNHQCPCGPKKGLQLKVQGLCWHTNKNRVELCETVESWRESQVERGL